MSATITRHAACACGKLSVEARGEPIRLSVCHCLDCQRRTGSAFGFQSRFTNANVTITGTASQFERVADSGNVVRFNFCPSCGTTLFWRIEDLPDFVVIAAGAFADPAFPAPKVSVYETRKHSWVTLPEGVEHLD